MKFQTLFLETNIYIKKIAINFCGLLTMPSHVNSYLAG